MAFTAAATSREFPTCVMGSWTVTVSENDTIAIWSVGRSCLMRASAAAFACSIFSPSIEPLESIAREMLRTRPAMTAADGVRSTAMYTEVPAFGFRFARLTVHFIASGDRRWGRFWGSITCFMFPPGGRAMAATLSYVLRPRSHEPMFRLLRVPRTREELGLLLGTSTRFKICSRNARDREGSRLARCNRGRGECRSDSPAERSESDAWARIRTWEPLREGILSPSPLTGLGYPRAAAQRPRPVKPFGSRSRAGRTIRAFFPYGDFRAARAASVVQYFTKAFFDEIASRLNADPEWGKKAAAITAKIVLTSTDRNASFLVDIQGGKVTVQQEGGPHEEHGPGLRADERDVVGAGDEEVTDHSIDERGAHQDREQPGRERRIEAQDDEGHERPDQDDADDEDEVDSRGDNLEGEVGRGVNEGHDEMGQDEGDQVPIETLHDSGPPRRESLGPPCRRDLLHAFHVGRKGRPPREVPPESGVRGREGRGEDPGSVSTQEHPGEPPRHAARWTRAESSRHFSQEIGQRRRPIVDDMPHAGLRCLHRGDERARGIVRMDERPYRALLADEDRPSPRDRFRENPRVPTVRGVESSTSQRERIEPVCRTGLPGNPLSIQGGGQDRITRRRRVLVERLSVQSPDSPDDALLEKRPSTDVGRCRDKRAGPLAPDTIIHGPIRGPGAHFRWDRSRRPDDHLASVRSLCNRLAVEQVGRSRFTAEGSHSRLRRPAPHQPDDRVTAGHELAHDPPAEDAASPGQEYAHTAVMSIERLNIAGLIVP